MKQSNRDCKIVRDLLPNYIEELTDEVTNEFINEHIEKCPECAQVLKDMNGEIKLEEINQDREIKYLKKIRTRVKQTIAIVSLIVIIVAACVVGYVYNKSKIQVNNYTFMKASYVVNYKDVTKDGKLYGTMIAVFDENDICISVRMVEKGYTEEQIEMKKNLTETKGNGFPAKFKIINDEIHYNLNIWNGLKMQEVKETWIQSYEGIEIEDI